MPCRQSSLASVPPPAPEPTMTTTSASSWSKCLPLWAARPSSCAPDTLPLLSGISALLVDARVRQPVEVVEAAVQIAALRERRPLVAEQRPDLGVVVERDDRLRAHGLEERGPAHAAQDGTGRAGVELRERRAARDVQHAQSLGELRAQPHVVLSGLHDRGGGPLVGTVREVRVREHRAHHRGKRALIDPHAGGRYRGHPGPPRARSTLATILRQTVAGCGPSWGVANAPPSISSTR